MTRYAGPVLLILLVGLINAPLLLHLNDLLYPRGDQVTDLTITHWPAVVYNVTSLRQYGQVPLWRTTIASGGPWAANPQSWLFYPPAWLFYLLPINLAFNLLLFGHCLLAALATYAWGRRALGLRPAGAALAGLSFALSPWLTAHLAAGHVNIAWALAWWPVALLGAHRAASDPEGIAMPGGAPRGMKISGSRWLRARLRVGGVEPSGGGPAKASTPGCGEQSIFEGALWTGVAWAAALLNHIQTATFGIALSLAWFLLTLFTAPRPVRWGRPAVRLPVMIGTAGLLSAALLIPLAEALPYLNRTALTVKEAGLFSLPWASLLTAVIPTYGGESEQVIYLGLPASLLALVGLLVRRDRTAWFFLLTAGLAALFAVGTHGPLFPLLARWVPGLSWFRVPPRIWGIVTLSLAVLAGRGLDLLSGAPLPAPAQRRATLATAIWLIAGLAGCAWLARSSRSTPVAAWSLGTFGLLSAGGLWLRIRGRLRPVPFSVAVLLLVGTDLTLMRAAWTEMRAPSEALAWGADAAQFLAAQPGQFRVYSPSYSLPQHTAVQYGLSLADGVDPFQLSHYVDFLAQAGGFGNDGYSPTLPPDLEDRDARPDAVRLGLLNVGYVAAEWPVPADGLAWVATIGTTWIYRNEHVLPRAFIAQARRGSEIVLSRPVHAAPASIAVYTPNRMVVEADADKPGLLVLSEVWYPGWRAKVDGVEAPIQRAEGVLRGVWLEAGRHTVEFRYAPRTVWAGLAVTGSTALALLLYAVWGWRKRR